MEVVTGALPSLLPKLGQLLISEYNLQREVKEGIKFLQAELESMKGALEKISNTPVDQLDNQDNIWARNVRELSYDIEDRIDTFMMVHCKGWMKPAKQRGFKKVIDTTLNLLMQPKIRHKIATNIRSLQH
jgi:collagenase-like PrtC family protease